MQEYKVTMDSEGTMRWYDLKTSKYHRVDGPAIEYADGDKYWYLDGVEYTESEFNAKMNPGSYEGREIEIDGITYTLKAK